MKRKSHTKSRLTTFIAVKLFCLTFASVAAGQSIDKNLTSIKSGETETKQNVTASETTSKPVEKTSEIKTPESTEREKELLDRVEQLEREIKNLRKLEEQLNELKAGFSTFKTNQTPTNATSTNTATTQSAEISQPNVTTVNSPSTSQEAQQKPVTSQQITDDDRDVLDFFRDTTINFGVDGYYANNFNRPFNRVNRLRAYDLSSNSFSLNQANVVIENLPNVAENRRFGFRLDLQYGQATETLQGNPNNELRPEAFRPIWQAYGTYVAPVGKGLTVDFGKFASSLGYETNYTKDNFNYSRSYFFNFLPYYHFGARASYPITDKLTATYWLVNGAQQTEDFNDAKSQAILFTYKPTEKIILQGNYYSGREQRDQQIVEVANPNGISTTSQRIIPRGKFQVLDFYGTFLITDKLTLALEGDYVVNRVNSGDAPTKVKGGVAYLRYQFTPKFALAGRGEYLLDRGGLFSGASQALNEVTVTSEYKFGEGFLVRGEYRRDWSNQPYFFTNSLTSLKKEQNTATLGFVWWFGRKKGAW